MKRSIRAKLTALILAVCLFIILTIWLSAAVLFKPMYYTMTQNELSEILNKTIKTIEKNDNVLSDEVIEEISSSIKYGVCIEIANDLGSGLVLLEGIGDACQLHGGKSLDSSSFYTQQRRLNTQQSLNLRTTVRENVNYSGRLVDNYDNKQAVRARFVDGKYTVVVSTNLSRTDSIIQIVLSQLKSTTFLSIILALIISAVMSNWFIRPLITLSAAIKEIAKGNYKVKLNVKDEQGDELNQLAQDFNVMVTEIESAQQMQKELIASISHDLRTPLTIIKGYAESVRDITGEHKEIREQQLTTIIDETDRLSAMVGSVLEYAKLNQPSYKLNVVQYDIVEMAKDIVGLYSHNAEKEDKSIVYEGVKSAYVLTDAQLMERVIHNFVSNALLHTPPKTQVVVSIAITPNGKVRLSVKDSGEGIQQCDIEHLFEKYYRSRKDTGKQGTGLGLAIVKAILDNHGFEYGVNSTLGQGSEFWVIM